MFDHLTSDCACIGKYCSACGQTHCFRAFNHDRRKKDGLGINCRECMKLRHRVHRQKNLELVRERERERARTEKEMERRKEYLKAYREKNSEYYRERNKEYRDKEPERFKAYAARNKELHPEYPKLYAQTHREQRAHNEKIRRARKKQAEGSYTLKDWNELCSYYDYTCLRCGRREPDIKLTADHVVPLSQGGFNDITNIQPLCHSCNASKHDKTIDYRPKWN